MTAKSVVCSARRSIARGAGALAVTLAVACTSELEPGAAGAMRFAGKVKGAAPLHLLPPVTDASGNTYVLYGAPDLLETEVFVGHAGGGWSAHCSLTKGDRFGARGWVGFAASRQWYWSGDALVAVSGADGACHAVLDRSPSTGASLMFRGVLPGVHNGAERRTLVALVQSATDAAPYSVLVDLDAEIMTNERALEVNAARDVDVLGVGAGVALLGSSAGALEARFFDADAAPSGRAAIAGGSPPRAMVRGFLQVAASGRVAGLLGSGSRSLGLVTFDRSGGSVAPITGMEPAGVHLWAGQLWLVGTRGGEPVVAPIDGAGRVGAVTTWRASRAAAGGLGGDVIVRDDRVLPSRDTRWRGVQTAIGSFPFVSAHALARHASGATLWLFAGPSTTSGGRTMTSFAMAPIGVSYP